MKHITEPYLLSVCVPVKIDSKGVRWCDELWAKDLLLHLDYIDQLTVACPRIFAEPTDRDVALSLPPFDRLKFVDLPNPQSWSQALIALPSSASKMWAASGKSKLVHTGFGGWPIPEGWIAVPIAWLRGKFLITYVESSPWRIDPAHASRLKVLRSQLIEFINRLCVRAADLRFFTSNSYQSEFVGVDAQRSYVTPATWIDADVILTEAEADAKWSRQSDMTRLVFVGRLTEAKGIAVLIDAINELSNLPNLSVFILGEGSMKTACEECARTSKIHVSLLEQINYGPEFFKFLSQFDAVIVPSISDEQPRIIFDAFSQAVPVLGSNTGGIRQIVDHEENGILFPATNSAALGRWLRWAADNRADLKRMGLAALRKSRSFTHTAMHEVRSVIISDELARR